MPLLYNLARMTVASSGTGTITLNSAVSGFASFNLAGLSTASAGSTVWYAINDTTQSEIGFGVYISSSLTLTRNPVRTSAGSTSAPINMSNAAQVFITPAAEGIVSSVTRQVFTVSGTYTPTPGLVACVIECIGGGGGGGGVASGGGVAAGGGGGGAGGYSRTYASADDIGTSQVVTIGAGGSGGAPGFFTGIAGGATSLGALCIANGGSGGSPGGAASQIGQGGAGGTAGTGAVQATGGRGNVGCGQSITTVACYGGNGASGLYGTGGAGAVIQNGSVAATAGNTATGFGAGGGGAAFMDVGGSDRGGGSGSAGIIIITEYVN